MAVFLVRVVLNNASLWDDYEVLHPMMERSGFRRIIVGDNKVESNLPPGEYIGSGEFTVLQVCNLAKGIVNAVWANNSVFVSSIVSWAGNNLEPVKKIEVSAAASPASPPLTSAPQTP